MKPGELTRIEDTLRQAYSDALAVVELDGNGREAPSGLLPGRPRRRAGRPGGRRRWLVAVAAGAAVAVVALVAGLLVPSEVQHTPPRPHTPPAPPSTGPMMAYVVGGKSSSASGAVFNSVVPVDLATGRALRPIGLGVPGPVGVVVVAPNGRTVYVVTEGGDVVPVNVATRRAEPPIRIDGEDPLDMLISPNGRTAFVLDYPNGVATINLVTNRPGRFIKIHDVGPIALTQNGKILYVATAHGQEVFPVDTATLRTGAPIKTGDYNDVLSASLTVAPNGRTMYLLSGKPGIPGQVLTPIQVATGAVLPPIIVSASALGAAPTISPDSRSAYMETGYGLMAVDLATGRIRWTVTLGGPDGYYPVVVSPDSQTVYTSGEYDIVRIDASTGGQVPPVLIDYLGPDFAFGPDGKLYVLGIRVQPKTHVGTYSWALAGFDPATGVASRPVSLPSGKYTSWSDLQFGG